MVILGLGTNLAEREAMLRRAVAQLRLLLSDVCCSSVYESKALLPEGAPKEWDMPFLNMAVRGETKLAPKELLGKLQALEQSLGRTPRGHWGPREIDIDILAYDDVVLNEPALVIPHAELLRRGFALLPLAELAPGWQHPAAKLSARELARDMKGALKKTEIMIA